MDDDDKLTAWGRNILMSTSDFDALRRHLDAGIAQMAGVPTSLFGMPVITSPWVPQGRVFVVDRAAKSPLSTVQQLAVEGKALDDALVSLNTTMRLLTTPSWVGIDWCGETRCRCGAQTEDVQCRTCQEIEDLFGTIQSVKRDATL